VVRFASAIGILTTLVLNVPACTSGEEIEDGADDAFPDGKADGGIEDGPPAALGVLALVNDRAY
jgi:hypothetical protein